MVNDVARYHPMFTTDSRVKDRQWVVRWVLPDKKMGIKEFSTQLGKRVRIQWHTIYTMYPRVIYTRLSNTYFHVWFLKYCYNHVSIIYYLFSILFNQIATQ
jgi:hypothetical protein